MNDLDGVMDDLMVRWRERTVKRRIWSVLENRKSGRRRVIIASIKVEYKTPESRHPQSHDATPDTRLSHVSGV